MKPALAASLAALGSLCLALPAYAAFNDVTLTTGNASFTVNGITLNVTGATDAIIESATVGPTTLAISAPTGSSFTISAPNLNQLQTDQSATTAGLTNTCTGSASTLAFTPTATTLITITPSLSSFCPVGSGGGGGGSSGSSAGSASSVSVAAPSSAPAAPAVTTPVTLQAQIAALLAQIAGLQAQLGTASAANATGAFARTLKNGTTGADVKSLQQYLNAHGFAVAKTGPGSSGSETSKFGLGTKAALTAFQKASGISPASGVFGPLTKAYVAAHP